MIPLYLDIEVIPTTRPEFREELAASITPPATHKKADSIAKWEEDTKPGLVDEAHRKACFNALTGEIICIGWAIGDSPIETLYINYYDSEASMIDDFFGVIDGQGEQHMRRFRPLFIGHNILNFDIPYIWRRSLLLGIRPPAYWPTPDTAPWKMEAFDTMTSWAGQRDKVKLDDLCRAFGIKGKDGMDGSQVYDYWLAGRHDEIREYCVDDVHRVRELHKRMTFAGDEI